MLIFFVLLTFSRFCCNKNTKQKLNTNVKLKYEYSYHRLLPCYPNSTVHGAHLLSYMQKSVIILFASLNDTLAFQSLQDPVHKWPSLFCVALVAPFQFYHRVCFSRLPFLSSAQLPLSCSINLPLLMKSFYVPSELVSFVSLPLEFYFEFQWQTTFSPVISSPLVTHLLIWSLT